MKKVQASGLALRLKWMLRDSILAVGKGHKTCCDAVSLVVRNVCDVLKVVTLVGVVTFVHPRMRRLWWRDVCPP